MPRPQHRAAPRSRALPAVACLILLAAAATADEPARHDAGGERPRPAPAARLEVEAYEGFGSLGPLFGSRHTPLAVPVGVALETCPDGAQSVSALDIGGWRYEVGNPCPAAPSASRVRVTGVTEKSGAATPGQHSLRCDPVTWRCRPAVP